MKTLDIVCYSTFVERKVIFRHVFNADGWVERRAQFVGDTSWNEWAPTRCVGWQDALMDTLSSRRLVVVGEVPL